jgi:carbon starvation protein CstA
MTTFLSGVVLLIVGGFVYGGICQKIFKPDDRKTPAFSNEDGVDFVPLKTWRTSLINLLNIAGTGPVLGAIQGILFGPIAFLLIPIGCVFGGALHDYFAGMMSMRNGGAQMPTLIKKYAGKGVYFIYVVFFCILALLLGTVFIYTPGGILATQVFSFDGLPTSASTWVIYGVIFAYYLIATFFPIDVIIGRIYPIFGAVLILSALAMFIVLIFTGGNLTNISIENLKQSWYGETPSGIPLIPAFFLTVACGIVSGFHSTQNALIARTVRSEKAGKMTFFNMMIVEGFIAMIWAASAMTIFNDGQTYTAEESILTVGVITKDMLGSAAGMIAVFGVIILAITSGDTALRALRITIAEAFKIDQVSKLKRLAISSAIFAACLAILIWAKISPDGFAALWRYFAWANQTTAIFTFASIGVYLWIRGYKKITFMAIIPGAFYAFLTMTFILSAEIGFRLPRNIAFILGIIFAILYTIFIIIRSRKMPQGELDENGNII